jgi:hypothetical protein
VIFFLLVKQAVFCVFLAFQKGAVPFSRELCGFFGRIVPFMFRFFSLPKDSTFWVSRSKNSKFFSFAASPSHVPPAERGLRSARRHLYED